MAALRTNPFSQISQAFAEKECDSQVFSQKHMKFKCVHEVLKIEVMGPQSNEWC